MMIITNNKGTLLSILLATQLISVSGQKQQEQETIHNHNRHVYTDSFSKYDEYDHKILDPNTIYGSPYGGFSRATRSRLASLPLYFPAYPDSTALFRGKDKDTTATETTTTSDETIETLIDDSMFYEIRDSEGRKFVCRVYHEDELESESITSSMFDTPIIKTILPPSNKEEEEGDDKTNKNTDKNSIKDDDKTIKTNDHDEDDHDDEDDDDNNNNNNIGSMIQDGISQMKTSITTLNDITTRLKLLDGVCTQFHMGWWSYEWCHGQHVAQFHVEMKMQPQQQSQIQGQTDGSKESGDNNKQKTSISIEHITKIGYFVDRQIEIIKDDDNAIVDDEDDDDDDGLGEEGSSSTSTKTSTRKEKKKNNKGDNDFHMDGTSMKKIGLVVDSFDNGDICPDTNKPRKMNVVLQCCGLRNTNKQIKAGGILYNGKPVQSSIAAIIDLHETQTCVYKATICTPVLCEGSEKYYGKKFGLPIRDDHEGLMYQQQPQVNNNAGGGNMKIPHTAGGTSIHHINIDGNGNVNIDGNNNDNIGKFLNNFVDTLLDNVMGKNGNNKNSNSNQLSSSSRSRGKRKEGESIRETLDRTLDRNGGCLTNASGGWWTYEFCYGRHVRQVHIDIKIDPLSGITTTSSIDDQYILGRYDDAVDEYDDKDEINYVMNPNKVNNNNNNGNNNVLGSGKNQRGSSASTTSAGRGNGAYFIQEYVGGDVCDDADVTDAVIKAGSVNKGKDNKLHRATTVRYFCGANYELDKVNEDSTCHYVIDVLIPDLCDHPLFRAPVPKTHVVKCLPAAIDDDEDDSKDSSLSSSSSSSSHYPELS